jgi:hypothetical protein
MARRLEGQLSSQESRIEIGVSNTKRRIFQTQCLEAQSGDGAHVADTFLGFPASASSDVDLFGQGQTGHKLHSLCVGISPVAQTFCPW